MKRTPTCLRGYFDPAVRLLWVDLRRFGRPRGEARTRRPRRCSSFLRSESLASGRPRLVPATSCQLLSLMSPGQRYGPGSAQRRTVPHSNHQRFARSRWSLTLHQRLRQTKRLNPLQDRYQQLTWHGSAISNWSRGGWSVANSEIRVTGRYGAWYQRAGLRGMRVTRWRYRYCWDGVDGFHFLRHDDVSSSLTIR